MGKIMISGRPIDGVYVDEYPRYLVTYTDNGRFIEALHTYEYEYFETLTAAKKAFERAKSEGDCFGDCNTDITLKDRKTGEIIAHYDAEPPCFD